MAFDDTATVSGSVVSFSNGADEVPIKSWEVEIAPTLTGKSAIEATQTGRNLLNLSILSLFSSGKYIGTSNYNSEGMIDILGGENYVISFAFTITDGRVRYWDAEGNQISNISLSNKQSLALVTPSNAVKMSFYAGQNTEQTSVTDFDPMLEYGSTATAYEPYTAPTTHTVQLGRTIYGGVPDVVKGEGQETYGKKVFDGTEGTGGTPAWTMISVSQGTMFRITVSDKTTTSATNTRCSYYTPVAQAQRADGTVSGAGTNVDIIDNRFSSVDDFKAWLAENPVTLVYELATPTDFTFEPVEISSRLGNNTMWSEQGNIELTYYKSGYGFTSVTVHKETPEGEPVVQTAKFHRIVYGGQADVVKGTCEPKNLVDFLSNIEPTYSGFTITVTSDYGINFSGTGTRTWAHLTKTIPCDFDAGTKLVFSIQEDKDYNIYVLFTYEDSSTEQFTIAGIRIMDSVAFTLAKKAVSVRLDVALLQASTEYNETLYCMIEKGTTKTDFAPYFAPFTFQPISMETDEGENTLFANEGDSSITYRKAVD